MNIKKILLYVALAAVLVLGGGYVGYRAYKSARQSRLIQQAKNYLATPGEQADRKALLCLQRALRYNSKDVEACRLMAQLAERGRSPAAMIWRSRVVELNPKSTEDRLTLAQTAITFRDYVSATNALEGVDAAGKKTTGYHNVAGAVAAAAGLARQAETHFLEASRLEPQNAVPQMNLAIVRLHGSNETALAEARATLKLVSSNQTNAAIRCQAFRELAADSMRFKHPDAALTLCRQLVQDTNSTFTDRLLLLDVLSVARTNELKGALADLQKEAGTNTARIYELSTWQMTRSGPAQTLVWLTSLPADVRTNMPVALLVAEALAGTKNWKGLQTALVKQNWRELEFVRYAFNALALRGQNSTGGAKAEWELALKAANNQQSSLVMLLRLAAQWKWQSEAEELLWSIVNRFPAEKWAVQALTAALYSGGRTRPLLMLFTQEAKRSPTDLSIKNNLAMTALLLDAKELKPHDIALEVYQKAPTNSAFASTYAFSLHLQKKNPEALKVMQSLPAKDLESPAIAGYYGIILKAVGNNAQAKPYLQWAFKAPLLPEEKKMFEKAAAGA